MLPLKRRPLRLSFSSICFSALLLASAAFPASAFQLLPMSREFTPSGDGATQSYDVVNDGKEPVAVELSMLKRQVDIDGLETQDDGNSDFLIYPSQIVLNPGETQSVRVTWLGDPQPAAELAYRLVAEQVSVSLNPTDVNPTAPVGRVEVLLRYLGSVYIHPTNTAANVVLGSIAPHADPNKPGLDITLNNQGNARAFLKNLRLHLISSTGASVDVKPEQLEGINNTTILAGHQRRFFIPYPDGASGDFTDAKFEFDQQS